MRAFTISPQESHVPGMFRACSTRKRVLISLNKTLLRITETHVPGVLAIFVFHSGKNINVFNGCLLAEHAPPSKEGEARRFRVRCAPLCAS